MAQIGLILTFFVFISSTPSFSNGARTLNGKNLPQITKFHVNTKIQMRYAITNIETKVKNNENEVKDVFFNMYIPKEAFVSNFSMIIMNKTYVAKVDTKENAKAIFENSTTTSGLIQSFTVDPKFKDGKLVSIKN